MAKMTKQRKKVLELFDSTKSYSLTDAVNVLKQASNTKFDQSVEFVVNLGIDAKKTDQNIRGAAVLPNGIGKEVRVAVFAQGKDQDLAREAGADFAGFDDLAEMVKAQNIPYDVIIATPDAMKLVGQLGQILGPRGLMPNPKVGTVSADVATAVKNAKGGQVRFKNDKNGIVHCIIGKLSFTPDALLENAKSLLADLKKLRPTTMKGLFIKRIYLSSTMGPGLLVDQTSINS